MSMGILIFLGRARNAMLEARMELIIVDARKIANFAGIAGMGLLTTLRESSAILDSRLNLQRWGA